MNPFGFILRWYHRWRKVRNFHDFWWGLPAFVAATLGVVCLFLAGSLDEDRMVDRYRAEAFRGLDNGDWQRSELHFRKLIRLKENITLFRFGLALCAQRGGDLPRARAMMRTLAPEDQAGYGRAHFWLAVDLSENFQPLTPQDRGLLLHHLTKTVELHPDNIEAHTMLGNVYVSLDRFAEAAAHFAKAAQTRPAMRMRLARMYALLGAKQQATAQATAAADHYAKQVGVDPADVESRLQWADSQLFLENFFSAVNILRDGYRRQTDERLRLALADVYANWAHREPNRGRKLELLQQALSFAPESRLLLRQLSDFAFADGPESAAVREQFEQYLAKGIAPGTVHFVLGTLAIHAGDHAGAVTHMRQAYELEPRSPDVLNNLAWALSHSDPPELERALELVDLAVELDPGEPELRETRGTILAKLGRFAEALTELERALPAFPDRAALHRTLADVYHALGQEGLAQKHRAQAAAAAAATSEPETQR